MAVVVLGGLLTVVVLNVLAVPALFLRYGVDRPGTAGAAAPRREQMPVLEDVGEHGSNGLTVQSAGECVGTDGFSASAPLFYRR